VTPSSHQASWLRAPLVVLSDRRPAPGAARTDVESAIEWALREHDGVWLVRHAEGGAGPAGGDGGLRGAEWSALEPVAPPPHSPPDDWIAYVGANTSYAERIIEQISPDGMVWIIGHRWLLVGAALREYGHRGPIGVLVDVPFPAPDQLEALPWWADVMAALCRVDLVGFRTPTHAGNFEACRVRAGRPGPRVEVFADGAGWEAGAAPEAWGTSFLHRLGSAARREPP
jgi:hypothetical protein